MTALKKRIDYRQVLKYAFSLLLFLVFNNLETSILPYSSAILVTLLIIGFSAFLTPLLYLTAFLIVGEVGFLGAGAIFCIVIVPIILIYRKFKISSQFEYVAFSLIALLGFIFLGNSAYFIPLDKRILTTILILLLSFICIISARAVTEKGLKFKLGLDEFIALAMMASFFGLGLCNLISPFVWKSIAVLVLLIACYIYRIGIGSILCAILGISLAIFHQNINFVSIFLLYGIFCECFMKISRFASALSVLVCDYLLQVIFGIYSNYTYAHLISILCGVICFSVIPTQILSTLKDKLYSFREKQLVKQSINRNRLLLSNKLYDLSNVFTEMASAFNLFKKHNLSEDSVKSFIEKDTFKVVCEECEYFNKCKHKEQNVRFSIRKLIDIGFAKGKLSLIDMPSELSGICVKPNNILYGLNKALADYRAHLVENENLAVGRDLIASEVQGIAEILRGLALDTGTLLKFHDKIEKYLLDQLSKAGFLVSELLLFGEEDNLSVSAIITMKEFSIAEMQNVISKCLNMKMIAVQRSYITEGKLYISFIKANDFDAVFGVAKNTKDGKTESGDTYSVTRISCDKFLIALSDGMGSGENAKNVSSASLSLIESFYKAGLKENLILDTVNKLLTINTEDSFTALDICVVDLKNCSADFIKYGSPYGFIISENGIKIVEGNTLPLGIIDGLKPSVATTTLNDGDIVLLVTDGISDAFNNSGALIDFLRTLTAKNPQTLANEVLDMAINLSGGARKDDMTALAVRIFKKIS